MLSRGALRGAAMSNFLKAGRTLLKMGPALETAWHYLLIFISSESIWSVVVMTLALAW